MKYLIIVLFCFILNIYGQEKDSVNVYELGEIEVTAKSKNVLNSVEITKNDFQARNAYSVFDAVQFSPGVYSSVSGKNEAQLSIRGFDQRQISFMIDGAPIYIPYDGSFDLNSIQLAGFSKVVVTKSVPSILYGPNSMGGNINLISENPVKNLSARLNYQNGSRRNMQFGLNGKLADFYFNAAIGYNNSDGFTLSKNFSSTVNEDGGKRDNSSYTSKSGMIKAGATLFNNLNIALSYNLIENKKDVPVNIYTSKPRYWRYTNWNKSLANLMFNSAVSSSITVKGNIFYENFKNVLDSYDNKTFTSQTKKSSFHSTYDDHSYGLNLSSYITSEILPLTKIIFLYKRDTHNEQGNYNVPFEKYEAEVLTAGIEEEFSPVEKLKTVAGISYDRMNPIFAENAPLRSASSSLNGNIGFNYKLSEYAGLNLNASKRTRFPTLKEFYSELLGSYLANPGLAPEQSFNYELGAFISNNNLTASAALFYSDVKDLIQIVSLGGNVRQYQNVNKAELKGTEFELKYNFSVFNSAINYTYLSSKNVTENSDLPNRPTHSINLLLNRRYDSGFEWNTETSFISKQYSFDSDSKGMKRLPDYLILNARIAQMLFSNYMLYFRVNNIIDKYYETEYGFPQPGREYFIGITAEW